MSDDWQAAVIPAILAMPEPFTGEDIRIEIARGGHTPDHPNAWGATINSLIRNGYIEPVGHGRMRSSRSHGRQTPIYQRIKGKQ